MKCIAEMSMARVYYPWYDMHWLDWQKHHEQWNFLLFLNIVEGNPNPEWWQSQPESVSGWLCEFGNRGI